MPYELNLKEEELKNKIAAEYFWKHDTTKIIGNVDFCVAMHQSQKEPYEQESLLWAEAKKGISNIYHSLVQLILTIGKARTFDKFLPPIMLGAFDAEKMAFIPYNDIHDIFYLNDFNWNVAPSNHQTKEFIIIYNKVKNILEQNTLLYFFDNDQKELQKFITVNFIEGKFGLSKTRIDKNNFIVIYNKWLQSVKPTISVNWKIAKEKGVIDGDFYLADLLSNENITLKDKLFVVLKATKYELNRHKDEYGAFISSSVEFADSQKAHIQFWNKYERPPKEEYWDYIIERRDLLVPQDIRERKGSFFTPQIWVELSQKYLTDVLGEDWQDEYYVWDCAAGTGNLLTGLTNKYHIWASTLDKQDVDVMKDRIKNGANLLEDHVFQFDFLNDDFSKLPKALLDIINNPQKRKKLVVYINPPYAETAAKFTHNTERINKRGVSFTKTQVEYGEKIGIATKELFAQFLTRIYDKIPHSIIGHFSKLKIIQGPNFSKFRHFFKADFKKGFVCPANSFDNVKGQFPIGFMIWKLNTKKKINEITCDIYNNTGKFQDIKTFYAYDENVFITDWFRNYHDRNKSKSCIGSIGLYGSDFQHNNFITIYNVENHPNRWTFITKKNLIETSIYYAVRHSIEASWLNDRDQFLHPNNKWIYDKEFQNDCLTYSIFTNNIQSKYGTNHWIPFTEKEVNARDKFESNFMTDFIKNKPKPPSKSNMILSVLFEAEKPLPLTPLIFSTTAQNVFNTGRELWIYYHKQPQCIVNASLYDIREHFQGRNEKGNMNSKSTDDIYMKLISDLRYQLKLLAQKIEPKIYEYEFLKK